ncbi:MAG: transposase [Desulfosalsimonadaceae bacterium]
MARYRRYFVPNASVFLTVVTAGRRPLFNNADNIASVFAIFRNVKLLHPFTMKAWVVMPDHLHLLIHTIDGRFDRVMHSFKRQVAAHFRDRGMGGGDIWQKRYYDHVVRDDRDFFNHLDYIHFNPVHHGIATRPGDFVSSSFHHYVARGWYASDWGSMTPDHIKSMNVE